MVGDFYWWVNLKAILTSNPCVKFDWKKWSESPDFIMIKDYGERDSIKTNKIHFLLAEE